MKVLLAGPDYEENLSIRYLSASLQAAGHETILASFNSAVDASAVANAAQSADLIGLSMCFQARAPEFLALAQRLKARDPGKWIVAGGHYASCAAEPLLEQHPEIDIVVIHEGERTLVEIAGAMPNLKEKLPAIAGIAYRDGDRVRFTEGRRTLDELDALPFPDRSGPVQWIAGVPTSYLMGSRGCYGDCAYCCITTLHRMAPGKRFRQRSVAAIADEMSALYRERGTRQFIFHDDNFLVPSAARNHARIDAFETELRRRGVEDIALVLKCRPADATEDVLRRLKALGLIRVFLGVESATARGLAALERDQTVENSIRALETCARLGISAQFTLMTFHPDATLETLRTDISFMRRFSGNPLNFCRAEIYAGTPLEKQMIELARATGDYRGRAYHMTDPVAELAWNASARIFHLRCWSGSSLLQNSIGLDHSAAVLKRFYDGPRHSALAQRVQSWVHAVNVDTIDLLEEVVELCASGKPLSEKTIAEIQHREAFTRGKFLGQAHDLRVDLQALRAPIPVSTPSWARVARPAAAALLAIGMQATVLEPAALAQQSQAAPSAPAKGTSSMSGRVVDPSGAAIPNAIVTIVHIGTGAKWTRRTSDMGQYEANNLPAGKYSVEAKSPGFKNAVRTGLVLQEGAAEHIDVGLTLEVGCCEQVAVELEAPKPHIDWWAKKKPFTYVVGEGKDDRTFRGVAKLVYGDAGRWLQIFEANRDVGALPDSIPYGTAILIPAGKRVVPKPIFKVAPVYPPSIKGHVWGDVVLEVLLNDEGAVEQVSLVNGDPELAEAAIAAVKQWRFRPVAVHGKPVVRFLVAITFERGGKVR